jgi:hypothetical protein
MQEEQLPPRSRFLNKSIKSAIPTRNKRVRIAPFKPIAKEQSAKLFIYSTTF